MKLLKKFQSLSWFYQLLILVLTVALCFYLFKTYLVLILIVASIIYLKLVWRIIFCRAKQTEKGVEFNLSRFAEIVLMLFFVLMAILMVYGIYSSSSPWYGYIFPIIVLFVQFASVIQVWSNRNDFIRIKDNLISFKDNDKEGSIEFKVLEIEERKTEAFEFKMSGDATGPFLIAIDQQNQKHAFDLKMMNLNGHVHALKTYLKTINKDEVN